MIATTIVVIEGESFFLVCHLDLPLDVIYNNDKMHFYSIVHAFDLHWFFNCNITCHTSIC